MKVFVHSIHSQVPDTIKKQDLFDFELVVSMDSHLDLSFGIDLDVYPEKMKQTVARTSVHTHLRRLTGDVPALRKEDSIPVADFIIAISEGSFAVHENYNKELIKQLYDIDIYLSPPKNLKSLISKAKQFDSFLLDIDYDYIYEAQGECYTPAIFSEETDNVKLQSIADVLKFIKKTKPNVITLSEAKLTTIQNSNSIFNSFLTQIRKFGYDVEIAELVKSDEETLRKIKDNAEFYLSWSKYKKDNKLESNALDVDIKHILEKEKLFAKKFFNAHGYSYDENSPSDSS